MEKSRREEFMQPSIEHGEAEEQVLNLRLEPQTMASVPNHDPYFPHFSKHKLSTCPLTSLYLNHKLAQKRATWKINILCTESLGTVSTVFTTAHVC